MSERMTREAWYESALPEAILERQRIERQRAAIQIGVEIGESQKTLVQDVWEAKREFVLESEPIIQLLNRIKKEGNEPAILLQELNEGVLQPQQIHTGETRTPYYYIKSGTYEQFLGFIDYLKNPEKVEELRGGYVNKSQGHHDNFTVGDRQYIVPVFKSEEKTFLQSIEIVATRPEWTLSWSRKYFNGHNYGCFHDYFVIIKYEVGIGISTDRQRFWVSYGDGNFIPEFEREIRFGFLGLKKKIVPINLNLDDRRNFMYTDGIDCEQLKPILVEAIQQPLVRDIFHKKPPEFVPPREPVSFDGGLGGFGCGHGCGYGCGH